MSNNELSKMDALRNLFIRLYPDEVNYKETGKYSNLSNFEYDEDEVTFHNVIAKIKTDHAILTPTDKQLIDEIGESLWNGNIYHRGCMRTKYWLELVDKPPYDNDNDPRRLIVIRDTTCGYVISERNRKTLKKFDQPDNWYRTELPLAEDTVQLLEGDDLSKDSDLFSLIKRDLSETDFEVLWG